MRISLVGPVYPYRGGIAQHGVAFAQALSRAGHVVQVVSFARQYPSFLYPGESDKDPSQSPNRVDAQYLLDPLYPWTWYRAANAILKTEPEMVVIQWWTTFWAPAYAALVGAVRKRTRVVFMIHNVLPHESNVLDRWLTRLALGRAYGYVVQAPHERDKLLGLIPAARISYCHLPVFPRFGEEVLSREQARKRLGLPSDRPVFLFFGIVRPYKGLRFLVRALARLSSPAHLVIAGEFWEDVSSYEKEIEKLALVGQVTLMNHYIPNEEAHVLFSAVDALVAPYVGGTQSAAVSVALGYGLSTIVTQRVAAGVDLSDHRVHVVPPADAEALAAAMAEVAAEFPAPSAGKPEGDGWPQVLKALEELR